MLARIKRRHGLTNRLIRMFPRAIRLFRTRTDKQRCGRIAIYSIAVSIHISTGCRRIAGKNLRRILAPIERLATFTTIRHDAVDIMKLNLNPANLIQTTGGAIYRRTIRIGTTRHIRKRRAIPRTEIYLPITSLTGRTIAIIRTPSTQIEVFLFAPRKLTGIPIPFQKTRPRSMKFRGLPATFAIFITRAAMLGMVITPQRIAKPLIDLTVAVVVLTVTQFLGQILSATRTPRIRILAQRFARLASLTHICPR